MKLRPGHMAHHFPELKSFITRFSEMYDARGAISAPGPNRAFFDPVMVSINRRLEALPVSVREPLMGQLWYLVDECARVAALNKFGRQTFLFDQSVLAELAETSLGDVRVDDVRLPFPAIYCAFDRPQTSDDTVFEGFYARTMGDVLRINLVTTSAVPVDWALSLELGLDLRTGQTFSGAIEREIMRIRDLSMKLRREMEDLVQDRPGKRLLPVTSQERGHQELVLHEKAVSGILPLVANCLCLLCSAPEDMISERVWSSDASPAPSRKLARDRLRAGDLPVRRLRFAHCEARGLEAGGQDGRRGPRAHWRRGHMRRQPVGPKNEGAFAPRWIRPTLVNPAAGGMAQESFYEVKP